MAYGLLLAGCHMWDAIHVNIAVGWVCRKCTDPDFRVHGRAAYVLT